MIYQFRKYKPVIHKSSFVHPLAAVIGNVIIGKKCYIGPGAALRGDWGQIVLEDGCNVQENATIHMFPGIKVLLKEMSHIGHGAIIHGSTIGENCLVGMNAVIMDNVQLGKESIVGALAFIREGTSIPPRSLVVGNPARITKQVTDDMIAWKTKGTGLYIKLAGDCLKDLKPCKPSRKPSHDKLQKAVYELWKQEK